MRVLLVNPVIRPWALPNCFPTGLGHIASVLRDSHHDVDIVDFNAERTDWRDILLRIAFTQENQWDLIGIGSIITGYQYVKRLCSEFKKVQPNTPIVLGGALASSIYNIRPWEIKADGMVVGEGERSILRALGMATARPGKFYCSSSSIEKIDEISMPAYDLWGDEYMETYVKNPVGVVNKHKWDNGRSEETMRSFNIISSRGCPYSCRYCYHDFMGCRWRARSPENVISEMVYLVEKYDVEFFNFNDDLFVVDPKRVFEFCKLLKKSKLDVFWECDGRTNIMTEKMLRAMKDAGCLCVAYGIESLSQPVLNAMDKKVTVKRQIQCLEMTEEIMGANLTSFIIGFPGETRNTIQETIDNCKKIGLEPEVVFFATAYPKTWLYDYAKEKGFIKDELRYIESLGEMGEKMLINFTDLTDEELMGEQKRMIEETGAQNVRRHGTS